MTINTSDPTSDTNASYKELIKVLDALLERDENITARAVTRLHPTIKHASSITRSDARSSLLAKYQDKQREIRSYVGRLKKGSKEKVAAALTDKDQKIAELERQLEILTASHVAMIRAVGELGGMSKWAKFYERYREVREQLMHMGAMPSAETSELAEHSGKREYKDG